MSLLLSLSTKCPKRVTAVVGGALALWILSSVTPLLGLQVCLVLSVLAYISARAALARVFAKPRIETFTQNRSLRVGAIGATVGASAIAIGAKQIMPDTFFGFFHSAAASSIEALPKMETVQAATQTAASFQPLTVPLASSLSIDASLLVAIAIAILVGRSHFLSAAGKLREKLKESTRSAHGPAILVLIVLAVITLGGSRAPTVSSTPAASALVDQKTNATKRETLEEQLAKKLTALRQLEAPLQGAGKPPATATNTKTFDDMNLWRNTSRPNPAELETLRADINKIAKELGSLGS